MAIAIAMMIVVVALVFTIGRMFLHRDQWVDEKPLNKQHRKIQQFEPNHEAPSIEDLIEEEAADLGLHDIPGGDGVASSVKLRVWHRDAAVRSSCSDGALHYELDAGTDPETADIGSVHLRCDPDAAPAGEAIDSPAVAAEPPGETDQADGNVAE